MTQHITTAKEILLEPAQLSTQQLENVISQILGHQVDYADLYFQNTVHEVWSLEDSVVKDASYNIDRGVGVRAVAGEKTGFAYSDDIALKALSKAANAAKSIAKLGQSKAVSEPAQKAPMIYSAINPITGFSKQEKINILEAVDAYARSLDNRITQVNASLSGVFDVVLIANSLSQMAADVRPLVRISISVIAEENGRRERGSSGGGGRFEYTQLMDKDFALSLAKDAVDEAILNLTASAAPAGMMPVVLGPGWPGVLLHEAVGHGLEGDFNRKGISTFSGCMGQQVAAKGVTVVDDGTLSNRRGSLNIDDEGTPTQCTTLIEDGVLVGYMQDRLNARLMGMRSTGNCRRQSYAHLPIPRMTNTYMLSGHHASDEIISSVEKGLYAVNFGGGQVDITSGKFVFSASEAYLIEKGKVTRPVKGATLIGNGPEVMKNISMVGNDLALDKGVGVCGKEGQSVPVGVGQPTLKIDALTVGGTQ